MSHFSVRRLMSNSYQVRTKMRPVENSTRGYIGEMGRAQLRHLAAKEQPAEDGDVVVGLDRLEAARAARAWGNNGDTFRNAMDTDIQEAADDDAEQKKEEGNHSFDCATGEETAQRGARWSVSHG